MPRNNHELAKFAARTAAKLLNVPEDSMLAVLDAQFSDLTSIQMDWAALIQAIIEAILMIMENCKKSALLTNAKRPGLFARTWFRHSAVRPALAANQVICCGPVEVTNAILDGIGQLEGTMLEVIYAEATKPEWNMTDDGAPA